MQVLPKTTVNWFVSLGVFGCSLLPAALVGAPAQSAEAISIRFGAAQRAIAIADLETFVSTGEIPRSLRWYSDRLTEEERAGIRAVLREPLTVEANVVRTFVNSPIGESLLRRFLALFWGGPNEEALFKALRASLVLASLEDGGLTVMNAIRKYPLTQLRIDLGVALTGVEDLKEFFIDDDKIYAAIQEKGATGITAASPDELPANFRVPAEPGPLEWETIEISFNNPERDPSKLVFADVYLPQGLNTPAPLIVVSHGVGSTRSTFTYLAEHLASHGFAVAALEHPDTSALRFEQFVNGFAERPNPRLFIQRPNDITGLLDALERKISEDPAWQGRLKTEGVGIFGQSLGGYTVLAAGGAQLDLDYLAQRCQDEAEKLLPFNLSLLLQCLGLELPSQTADISDDRVAAVLAVNPVSSSLFGPKGMSQLQVPTMMVAGSHDFLTPAVDEQIVPFTWLENDAKYLMFVENGTHFSFLTGGEDDFIELPQQLIGPDQVLSRPAMQWMATTFFETYINDSSEYRSFLTEFVIQSYTADFKYAVTRSFTQDDLDAAIELVE